MSDASPSPYPKYPALDGDGDADLATGTHADENVTLGSQGSLPPTLPREHLVSTYERNRMLELSKYFEACQVVPASQADVGDEQVAAAPSAPAADTTLTALAQLGAFKLSCDRAFISLINSTHQYIIGEATQSTSLLDNALRSEDGLCLGVRALELTFGVCPQTIQVFTSDDRTISTNNVYADKTRYIIRDFTADSHFKDRPYVKGWPHMRSYAEVPLKSASGYVVGSYCVVDTQPRDFDDSEIQVLSNLGATIMNHLELLKSQLELSRVQRLVRGISSYAAGYAGLQEDQDRPPLGTSTSASSCQPVQESTSLPLSLARGDPGQTNTRPAVPRVDTNENIPSLSGASLGRPVDSETTSTSSESGYRNLSEPRADDAAMQDHPHSSDPAFSKAAFAAVSRASHLIRQSMDLAGVVFVKPHAAAARRGSSVTVSTASGRDSEPKGSDCVVMGHSVNLEIVYGNEKDASGFTVTHSLLRRLLERYPFGHVFSYDDLGAVQPFSGKNRRERRHPSQADSNCTETPARPSESDDAAELRNAAKGARSIAFTTLWDYRNDKWFAASISWTVDPLRIFDAGELNYLSVFGSSITAEVSRLEVSALSKAKSDFISSISHEMRSPLHGILAGTEILRDTMKLETEVSMLNSIDACGSMLLDTINHLLDYSKILNLSKRRPEHPSGFPKDGESNASEFPVINLSKLVQDVVEGVFLGNMASGNSSGRDTSDDTTLLRNLRQSNSDHIVLKLTETGDMITIIDIDPSVDWRFKTEGAAWKRIIMNLFGNAMKFTKKGQITVKLHLTRRGTIESDTAEHVCVEIHDTGSGIKEDYLQSHLFTAFSQADDISVGTGVGLSIVKRLVEELNGFIDVQSDDGIGTRVCVAIPVGEMTSPVNGPDSMLYMEPCLYANGRHKGHVLYVQGPPSNSPEGQHDNFTDTSSSSSDRNAATATNPTMEEGSNMPTFFANLAREGFGMNVLTAGPSGNHQTQNDVSPHSVSLRGSTSGGAWTLCRRARGKPDNASEDGSNSTVVSIRQPFGPRTFASALDEIMTFAAAGAKNFDVPATKTIDNRRPGSKPPSPPKTPQTPPTVEEKRAPSPVDQHEHAVFESEPQGTKSRAQESTSKTPEEAAPRNNKTAPHLLLVDDNAVNLKVLAASVKKGGCTYDQAVDGRQAVEAFKSSSSPYDLVFMDLSMPVLDGIGATRAIRKHEEENGGAGKRTQIVALTALDDDKHRQRAFEAGVDDFITKPVRMARVRELAELAYDG